MKNTKENTPDASATKIQTIYRKILAGKLAAEKAKKKQEETNYQTYGYNLEEVKVWYCYEHHAEVIIPDSKYCWAYKRPEASRNECRLKHIFVCKVKK